MNGIARGLISYLRAAAFVAFCQVKGGRVSEKYAQVRTGREFLDATVYLPRGFGAGKIRGTIFAVHGMSATAHADPRLAAVCRAFAKCGYVVVSPLFRDIADFTISRATVTRIAAAVRALAGDRQLCPSGSLSIFAPSFSAGMSMIAASMPGTANLVRAICSVGAYGSVESAVRDLMERQDLDEYGRLIMLKNFIHLAPGFCGKTAGVLREAILDNGLCRTQPRFPEALASLSKPRRSRVVRLLNDPAFRLRQWTLIVSRSARVRRLLESLSVADNIDGLRAGVTLIHGKGDTVISPRESGILLEKMRGLRVPARLCVTPLISHGDTGRGAMFFAHAWELVAAFAFFFRHSGVDAPARA